MWQQFIHEKPFFDEQIDILGCKKLLVCRKNFRSTKKFLFQLYFYKTDIWQRKHYRPDPTIINFSRWRLSLLIIRHYCVMTKSFIVVLSIECVFFGQGNKTPLVLKTFLTFVVSLRLLKSNSWQKTLVLLNNFFLFVSRKTCNLSIVLIRNIVIESLY